jgi:DNA-binding XRE family transcriptional regulator
MFRKKAKVSQEKLALEAGCDRTTVSNIERGIVSPKLETMDKMCRIIKTKFSSVVLRMERLPSYR